MPVTLIIICLVAFLSSGLTFFSGFGLGTLLLPAFALFFPIEHAVALTGVVHLLNGLFKLALVGRHADKRVLIRFGLPAFVASFVGAWVLTRLADVRPIAEYLIFGKLGFPARLLPVGGVLSGFFGGLAGMQGALRSAFLLRAGLGKEAFIGTGVAIAALIDLSRIGVYSAGFRRHAGELDYALLTGAVLSAFAGAFLGNRYLTKLTLQHVQRIVAALLFAVGLGLVFGIL